MHAKGEDRSRPRRATRCWWPDLVYTELIAMIAVLFLLVIWAVVLKAPLEQPATGARQPNPSRPLVLLAPGNARHFDPWMAGDRAALTIIAGLIAIPFISTSNTAGSGYFINERKLRSHLLVGFV